MCIRDRYRKTRYRGFNQRPNFLVHGHLPLDLTINLICGSRPHSFLVMGYCSYSLNPPFDRPSSYVIQMDYLGLCFLCAIFFFFSCASFIFFLMLRFENYAPIYARFWWIVLDLCALFASLLTRSLAAPRNGACFPAWKQDDTFEHFEISRLLGTFAAAVWCLIWNLTFFFFSYTWTHKVVHIQQNTRYQTRKKLRTQTPRLYEPRHIEHLLAATSCWAGGA